VTPIEMLRELVTAKREYDRTYDELATDSYMAGDHTEAGLRLTAAWRNADAVLAQLQAGETARPGWMPIETAPKDEVNPFLVYIPAAQVSDDALVLQVARFEGNLYPDHLGANVDWRDRVTRATHWQPLPAAPSENGLTLPEGANNA
jgi:hypothetical protein